VFLNGLFFWGVEVWTLRLVSIATTGRKKKESSDQNIMSRKKVNPVDEGKEEYENYQRPRSVYYSGVL